MIRLLRLPSSTSRRIRVLWESGRHLELQVGFCQSTKRLRWRLLCFMACFSRYEERAVDVCCGDEMPEEVELKLSPITVSGRPVDS